jgi:hypothetical protein
MAFPTIKHGIVCEDVRIERQGLISILGFYGVMPEVEIVAQQLPGRVRLSLLFIGGPGDGTYDAFIRIARPDGREMINAGPLHLTIEPAKSRTNLAFQLIGLDLAESGTYAVSLTAEGSTQPAYEGHFSIRQATADELLASGTSS